jgi:tRNA uridine 5-carbamoylmethylation protein Kti12
MLQGRVQNLVSLSIARSQKAMTIKTVQRQQTQSLEEMKEKDQKNRRKKEKELEDVLDNKKSVSIALVGVLFLPGALIAVSFRL